MRYKHLILIFCLLILFSSIAAAKVTYNRKYNYYEGTMDKITDSDDAFEYLLKKSSDSEREYTTSGDGDFLVTKGKRKTKYKVRDFLHFADIYIVLPSGEIELFKKYESKSLKRAGKVRYYSMGKIYGELSASGGGAFLKVKNGNFRRKKNAYGQNSEMILYYDAAEKIPSFYLTKLKSGFYISVPKDYGILTTSTRRTTKKEVFDSDFSSLPSKDPSKTKYNLKYALLSCQGECDKFWVVKPTYNTINVEKKLSLTSETAGSLKIGNPSTAEKTIDMTLEPEGLAYLYFAPVAGVYPLRLIITSRKNVKIDKAVLKSTQKNKKFYLFGKSDGSYYIIAKKQLGLFLDSASNADKFIVSTGTSRTRYGSANIYYNDAELMTILDGKVHLFKQLEAEHVAKWEKKYATYFLNLNRLFLPKNKEKYFISMPPPAGGNVIIDYLELSESLEKSRGSESINLNHIVNKNVVLKQGKGTFLKPAVGNFLAIHSGSKIYTNPSHSTWNKLNLGFDSLTAWVYDEKSNKARILICNNQGCTLDGYKISYPRTHKQCKTNFDCGAGKICLDGICVNEVSSCLNYGNTRGKIIVDVFSDDMDANTMKKYLDGMFNKLFSIAPFNGQIRNKNVKDMFTIRYRPTGVREKLTLAEGSLSAKSRSPSDKRRYKELGTLKCKGKESTVKIFLTKQALHAYAYDEQIYLTDKDSFLNIIFVHEFGHAFGNLVDEYYEYKKGETGDPGINCVESYDDAKKKWGRSLARKAMSSKWYSCGGQCNNKCKKYLKPSENSIMNEHRTSNAFNIVCKEQLIKKLEKFI